MTDNFNLTESEQEFEEKVSVIADEVLNILKELHQENKQQISSKLIADKMVWKPSVKGLFTLNDKTKSDDCAESESLQDISDALLDKLKDLLPTSMTDKLNELKDDLHNNSENRTSEDWLESPINIIKRHIDSITKRNRELEDFMVVAMQHLSDTESHFASELSSHQDKFSEDRIFEDRISENMNMMSEDINLSGDVNSIKSALMNKIENINTRITDKREQDMHKLKETEKTLDDMSTRLSEIKEEADEIRKKSQEIEVEAITDALTGLHNRKGYDEKLSETIAHVNRYNIKSSFMICDIDFFKQINDNFGRELPCGRDRRAS